MFRYPRREDHTTWTAVAPDAVFTVLTYATRRAYEPPRSPTPYKVRPSSGSTDALRSSARLEKPPI
jgi:hypothetical protein